MSNQKTTGKVKDEKLNVTAQREVVLDYETFPKKKIS